jgi:hypothetical protein
MRLYNSPNTTPHLSDLYRFISDWGEMGFFRVELGKNLLMIESNVAWATPGTFSTTNYPCSEGSGNCLAHHDYVDPSNDMELVERRLRELV